MLVEVNMGRRQNPACKMVLVMRQPGPQASSVMVEQQRYRTQRLLISLPFLGNQLIADQITDKFRAVCVPPFRDEGLKLFI